MPLPFGCVSRLHSIGRARIENVPARVGPGRKSAVAEPAFAPACTAERAGSSESMWAHQTRTAAGGRPIRSVQSESFYPRCPSILVWWFRREPGSEWLSIRILSLSLSLSLSLPLPLSLSRSLSLLPLWLPVRLPHCAWYSRRPYRPGCGLIRRPPPHTPPSSMGVLVPWL